MAKQVLKKNTRIVEITGMSVAGGELSLPKNHKYFVNIRLDYSDVEPLDAILLASEGSSVRVKAQAKLRANEKLLKEKGKVAESAGDVDVKKLGWIDFDVATDFEAAERGPRDPEKTAKSALGKMDFEGKVQFIMLQFKVERAMAEQMAKNV